MSIFDMLKNPALLDLIKDQHLKEIVTRREVRVSQDYFHRELIARAMDEEIHELSMKFYDGYGEISGKVKKKLIPFSIPFSARFGVERIFFTPKEKMIFLKIEEVKPVDVDFVTRKVVEKIPFLSYCEGTIACDLTQVPELQKFLAYNINGIKVCDFLTIKELLFREGEMIGRLGLCL
ncbi:hypothetical protein Geob_0021 [Geotalea daltonii FRC-32]|uniref:Uncharacterized protein n=1 Tax=Geotalea daltonii (strain DSM 22248 / JCM 15807 / FRC-32) TaxID=316067 RepID=B9M7U0_GEODF|nr:hypothetical protein [Geotalea daltonii]ACM18398.1 hypothetical protein Geob_0021 [Geotalea daltonii FRC-32]